MISLRMQTTISGRAYQALLATVFCITFSIALGQFFAGVCLLFFGLALFRREIRFPFPPVMFLVVAFCALAMAQSVCFGGMPGLWRRCGKLCWFLLIPVTAALVARPSGTIKTASSPSEPGHDSMILWAFLAGSAVLGLKDLILYPVLALRKPLPDYLTALIDKGSMTDGQMLMLGVVGTTFLIVSMIREERRIPWAYWGILLAQGAGLLINFKRGSWFCALILVAVIFLIRLRWKAWLMASVVILAFFLLPPVQSRMGQLSREFNSEGGGRLTMWFKIAPQLIRDNPMGVGYGCLTNDRMKAVYRRVEPHRNHLHANWAQVLVETGWIGFLLYLAWMIRTLCDGATWIRTTRGQALEVHAAACMVVLLLAGLMLNGLVEYNFGDTEMMFVYAVMMGLAVAGARSRSEPHLTAS